MYDIDRYFLHSVFFSIKQRCNNPNSKAYKYYGGRGIKCEWKNLDYFCKDMQGSYIRGLTIDRINNDSNYCKENCRWVTMKEQTRNKSNTVRINGMPLIQICEYKNIPYKKIYSLYRKGKDISKYILIEQVPLSIIQ